MQGTTSATRERWAGYVFVAIAAVAMALPFGRGDRRSGDLVAAGQRRPMPSLELRLLDGGLWRLADHRGHVIVINYWATWCAPCREETPALMRLSDELGPFGLAVVGIAMDEGSPERVSASVRHFVDALHVSYPVALPVPMSQMAYGMDGLPTTILVDRGGRVAKTYVGATRETHLKADVRALLGEAAPL